MAGGKMKHIIVWINRKGGFRLISTIILVGLLLAIFSYEESNNNSWTTWSLPLSGKVIILDAGHGGPDGGAVSSQGIIEKEVSLPITNFLREYLQEGGAIVYMTREGDYDLADQSTSGLRKRKVEDLHNRVKFVNERDADFLISIHLNSIPSPKWYGAQTFYYPTRKENGRMAYLIQDEIIENLQNTSRKARKPSNEIYLLQEINKPGVMVEVGFLSHPEESMLLADIAYQKKLAASIYQGILRFYSGEKVPGEESNR